MGEEQQKPEIFELRNEKMQVKISNYGATITSLSVPDKDGQMADVVLGFDSLEPYLKGAAPYFGCIVGRVANRIKDGKFRLDGIEYTLPINNPPNSLHGGDRGFDKMTWEVADYNKNGENPSITLKHHSRDGDQGYPGDVLVTATYTLTSTIPSLRLDMEALPQTKPTPISLAQHTYWNLSGHASATILPHKILIRASHITPVDETLIPTGELTPVEHTPFDFTSERAIGDGIREVGGGLGYDHNYALDGEGDGSPAIPGLRHCARLRDPSSSRALDVWTDAPGMQLYTGNYVDGVVGKGGAVYGRHSGVCLETQGFPDAVNRPEFPSVIVRPGFRYKHTVLYRFSVQ